MDKPAILRPRPIAEQVRDILVRRITDGTYLPESKLPSEATLSEELGVSRASVRSALAVLAGQGLLSRKHGNGTYLNKHSPELVTQAGTVWEQTKEITAKGGKPTIEVLAETNRAATDEEARALGIAVGDEVLSFDRLFRGDGIPIFVSRNTVPRSMVCTDGSLAVAGMSIVEFLERYCDRRVGNVIVDISAVLAAHDIARHLGIPPASPVLRFDEVFQGEDGSPLVCGASFRGGEPFRLRVRQS